MNTINEAWFANVEDILLSDIEERGIQSITIYICKYETYTILPHVRENGNVHQQNYGLHNSLRVVEKLRKAGVKIEFVGMIEKLKELGIEDAPTQESEVDSDKEERLALFIEANKVKIVENGYTEGGFASKIRGLSENAPYTLEYVLSENFKEEAKEEARLLLAGYKDYHSITVSFFQNCLYKQVSTELSELKTGCYVKTLESKDMGFVLDIKVNKVTITSIYTRLGGSIEDVETKVIKKKDIEVFMQPKNTDTIMQALDRLQKQYA